jgi:preprotein translocase subunit SecB
MIPTKVTLERLNYERGKVVSMTAVGLNMEDAVNFRFNIEQLGFFKVVEIQNANTDTMEGKPVVRFQLVCKIKPDKEETTTDKSETSKESSPGD